MEYLDEDVLAVELLQIGIHIRLFTVKMSSELCEEELNIIESVPRIQNCMYAYRSGYAVLIPDLPADHEPDGLVISKWHIVTSLSKI